jgi:hypothetical protein
LSKGNNKDKKGQKERFEIEDNDIQPARFPQTPSQHFLVTFKLPTICHLIIKEIILSQLYQNNTYTSTCADKLQIELPFLISPKTTLVAYTTGYPNLGLGL